LGGMIKKEIDKVFVEVLKEAVQKAFF
jgi:hypothetical protein